MASWMRLDPSEMRSVEIDSLDLAAFGLFWWMSLRAWEEGGLADDPALFRRALRGRIDGSAFDEAWRQVRAMMDVGVDGKLRIPWVERVREDTIANLQSQAERQRLHRLRAKESAPQAPARAPVTVTPRDVPVIPADVTPGHGESPDGRTDGRTDVRTDEPQKRAPRERPPAADPWIAAVEELVPAKERLDWIEVCAVHAAHRRRWKHPKLQPDTWHERVKAWLPRGLAAFRQAVADSGEHGWQGLFPPKAGTAPAGTIQKGPNRGQPSARDLLLSTPPAATQNPVRETTARVVNP